MICKFLLELASITSLFFSAIAQHYIVEVHNEAVILGNEAMVACEIPSFVSDLIGVVGWVDGEGNQYGPTRGAYGNPQSYCIPTLDHLIVYICTLSLML